MEKTCLSHCVKQHGAPQGTALSPFLFTLYTFSYNSTSCLLQKFSGDSVIVGCMSMRKEDEYRDVMDSFVEWCGQNHLQLNTRKTKELVIDFSRWKTLPTPISIHGVDVDSVQDYKCLGVHLDSKLDWGVEHQCCVQEGPEPTRLSEEAPVIQYLQYNAEDALPGCGS